MRKNQTGTEWLRNTWRPLMSILYAIVCAFDFIVFPILWSLLQLFGEGGQVTAVWVPISLSNGGFFHIAMGAVLGISAWTRGYEKITANRANNDGK